MVLIYLKLIILYMNFFFYSLSIFQHISIKIHFDEF